MIKAIIFDLNGIFIRSPKLSHRFKKDFGISSEIFLTKLSEIMEQVRKPMAKNSFEYWKPVLKNWNIQFKEKNFWEYWFRTEQESKEMISIAKELRKKGIKIFILSNNFKERTKYYRSHPWMNEVTDKSYFSWETGLVKPNVEAWNLVLSENNLKPEECLYFDDQEKNIKVSEKIGIKSFVFTNEEDLKIILSKYITF